MNAVVPQRSRGATLIELMVAASLGLVVIGAVGALFIGSSKALREDQRMSFMNQELGFAIAQLVQDIEMAGHWARLHDPALVELHGNLAVSADCGPTSSAWAYAQRNAISVVDNPTAAAVNAGHQCIDAAGVMPGSDVIAIKRVMGSAAGNNSDMSGQTSGAVYLRTGNLSGRLYLHDGSTFGNVPPPFENWEYRPVIYYIHSSIDGTGEPGLCRRVLRPTAGVPPAFEQECLAQGVENMQIEVGVDTDTDGAANYYTSAPDPAETAQVVSVRLYLLARASRPDFNYRDPGKSYQFANMAAAHVPANDSVDRHYYHKTLSSEIVLRNPRNLSGGNAVQ